VALQTAHVRRALLTGWEIVAVIVASHLEANVGVRIAPKVRPHGVGRKTDRIRIGGQRTGTATAIHPVRRFRSGTDGHDFDTLSRETSSIIDMPLCSVSITAIAITVSTRTSPNSCPKNLFMNLPLFCLAAKHP
jgi:hypothetical protein